MGGDGPHFQVVGAVFVHPDHLVVGLEILEQLRLGEQTRARGTIRPLVALVTTPSTVAAGWLLWSGEAKANDVKMKKKVNKKIANRLRASLRHLWIIHRSRGRLHPIARKKNGAQWGPRGLRSTIFVG